jgi:hypothetical protein
MKYLTWATYTAKRVNFGSWFWRFKSKMGRIHCLGLWGGQLHIMVGARGHSQTRKQREGKDEVFHNPLWKHVSEGPKVLSLKGPQNFSKLPPCRPSLYICPLRNTHPNNSIWRIIPNIQWKIHTNPLQILPKYQIRWGHFLTHPMKERHHKEWEDHSLRPAGSKNVRPYMKNKLKQKGLGVWHKALSSNPRVWLHRPETHCSQGWPQTYDPSVSAYLVLGFTDMCNHAQLPTVLMMCLLLWNSLVELLLLYPISFGILYFHFIVWRDFLISLLISSMTHLLFRSILVYFHVLPLFTEFLLLLTSSFIPY